MAALHRPSGAGQQVDPQPRRRAAARQLAVARPGEKNLLRGLEAAVRSGGACLLEDVGEALDPSLETVLAQAVYHDQGRTLLKVGDTAVDFNDAFRLYITTKLPNPHYLPEVLHQGHAHQLHRDALGAGGPAARPRRARGAAAARAAKG